VVRAENMLFVGGTSTLKIGMKATWSSLTVMSCTSRTSTYSVRSESMSPTASAARTWSGLGKCSECACIREYEPSAVGLPLRTLGRFLTPSCRPSFRLTVVHCIPVWRHRSQVSASFCPRDGRTHLNTQSLLPVGSPRTKKAAHRIRTFRHCSHAVVYMLMHRMDIKVMNSSMDSRVCLDPEKTRGSGVQIWTATKNNDAYICSSLLVKRLQSYLSGRRNESAQP